jgi:hypothetical protein
MPKTNYYNSPREPQPSIGCGLSLIYQVFKLYLFKLPFSLVVLSHHAEGLVNPKVRAIKKVTEFGYPRACRFRKHQIENIVEQ